MSAHNPAAMATADFGPLTDDTDDLPRTLRREKEARAQAARDRAARERADEERAAGPSLSPGLTTSNDEYARARPQIYRAADIDAAHDVPPSAATVARFDVPFFHLVKFLLKAVVASIPALVLLGSILWFAGWALEAIFPQLIKMKILISFPN